MKIVFAVENNAGIESKLDSRFGRAAYFLVYDTDKKEVVSVVENKYKNEGHGVGIKAATLIVESGCNAAIGAQPGPKAAAVLQQAKIKTIADDQGTVKEALEKYKEELAL